MNSAVCNVVAVDGSASRAVPGKAAGLAPISWCHDGTLLAFRRGEIPAQVVRIDLQTGKQQPWKELVPRNRTALSMVQPIRFSPDCEGYAYSAQYDLYHAPLGEPVSA